MRLMLALLALFASAGWAQESCNRSPSEFLLLDASPQSQDVGVDYSEALTHAFRKESVSLALLFQLTPQLDGSGAETHAGVLWALLQCWGDSEFAAQLKAQRPPICQSVLGQLDFETEESGGYKTTCPKTYALKQLCLEQVAPPVA